MENTFQDDGLDLFAMDGPPALPAGGDILERDGARVWFASFGEGPAVLLLHGGMGNSNNFGHQVPALVEAGYRVVVIDSRGHGRSSWDGGAFSYAQFAGDAFAVLDRLGIRQCRRSRVERWGLYGAGHGQGGAGAGGRGFLFCLQCRPERDAAV